ncbi:MAG TPA: tetratricopeptide repeat protein [Candidatus Omnitrophica bacterium]|nr:tetratricopeptide repeat protein [Candidatus Omnitrophota bacterium]
MEKRIFYLIFLLALSIYYQSSFAQVEWWDESWECRKTVELSVTSLIIGHQPEVARVSFTNGGYIREDASDIRVIDTMGRFIPYKVIYSKPYAYTTIAFKTTSPQERYYIYFGNPQARAPKYDWDFEAGLILETRKKGRGDAGSWLQMKRLLRASREVYGRGFVPNIFLGYNPYGPDDNFISIFTGYLYCPEEGKYSFATASDDASFLFIDDKLVTQWPGWHGANGGRRAEYRGEIWLNKGIHKIQYYHLEARGGQAAVAYWKRPSDRWYEVIPPKAFVPLFLGRVVEYRKKDNPYPADFHFKQQSNLWFENDTFAMVKFYDKTASSGRIGTCRWDFGDGQVVSGSYEPQHVYLIPKEYRVKLEVTVHLIHHTDGKKTVGFIKRRERGRLEVGVPGGSAVYSEREILKIEEFKDTTERVLRIKEAVPFTQKDTKRREAEYFNIISGYDFNRFDESGLSALLRYYQFLENQSSQAKVYRALLKKNLPPSEWYQYSLRLAEIYEKAAKYNSAIELYNTIIKIGKKEGEVQEVLLRKGKIYLKLDRLDEAEAIFQRIITDSGKKTVEKRWSAYISLGDIYRERGDYEKANRYYLTAEEEREEQKPLLKGMYIQRIEGFIRDREYDRALEELDRLEELFPTYKMGYGAYLRSLCLYHKGDITEATEEVEFLLKYQKDAVYIPKVRSLYAIIKGEEH